MTTTKELIAQLRANGIPDWNTARYLMAQAANHIESLSAEVERLKTLSVSNILLDVVPGDGSGFEVYAKSVADVESKLSKMGEELEDWQLGIRRYQATEVPAKPVLVDMTGELCGGLAHGVSPIYAMNR